MLNKSNQYQNQEMKKEIVEYITVPRLSDVPNYRHAKFYPCAMPKISIPHPNCQVDLFKCYVLRAVSTGLMPYVLTYFDHMFIIPGIKPHFLKHMTMAEFNEYYEKSKTLWNRPDNWDEPARNLDVSFNEMRRTA